MFCYAERGDSIIASREHLVSQPIANAFGIDRTSPVIRLSLSDPDKQPQWRPLNGISRRCVCRQCNSTWMNQMESDMGRVARWLDEPEATPLGEDLNLIVRRWAIKTHLLLCFIEGEADQFLDPSNRRAVLPPLTLARLLFEGDIEGVLTTPVGLALSASDARFGFAHGHPTVTWKGANRWNPRFCPASVVTIGPLQLWVTTPHLDAQVFTPRGVTPCKSKVQKRDLSRLHQPRPVECVEVDYGKDHDAEATMQAVMRQFGQDPRE